MRLRDTPLLVAAAILTSLPAFSTLPQSPPSPLNDPNAQDTTTTDAQSPAPTMTPEQIALIQRYLTTVHAQPIGRSDTRTASPGQGITLQVIEDVTLANGTQLARGTKLTGHVLRAQAWQQDGPAALLSISIDRAILKDGSSIPIRCVLRTVVSSDPGVGASGVLDASQQGSRPRRNAGGPSVGGPTGGAIPLGNPTPMGGSIGDPSGGDIGNSPLGGGTSSGGGSGYPGGPNSTSTRGGVSGVGIPTGDPGVGGGGTAPVLGNATAVAATAPELPVTAAGESLHDTPHPSGLPGVMLSGASVAGISGTLSAFERNFTLDSGTQLTLGVISAK